MIGVEPGTLCIASARATNTPQIHIRIRLFKH